MEGALQEMGLNAYEARSLAFLARHGEADARKVARAAEIPFGRVYDVLHGLADRELLQVVAGRPKRFVCAPLATIPGRLLASERRRLQTEDKAAARAATTLEQDLQALAPAAAPVQAHGVKVGEEAAREFLVEATNGAVREVVTYLRFGAIQKEDMRIFDAFRGAVARGLRTRILLRGQDVDDLLQTPYVDQVLDAMLPHLGEHLQVRLSWDDAVPFAAIDGARAMIGVRNPIDPSLYFAVVHIEDPGFTQGLVAKFEGLWEAADEPGELIQWALGKRGGRALAKFGARVRKRESRSA